MYPPPMAEAPEQARFILRIPKDAHEYLTEWAKRENRSLNAQIWTLLRRDIEQDRAERR